MASLQLIVGSLYGAKEKKIHVTMEQEAFDFSEDLLGGISQMSQKATSADTTICGSQSLTYPSSSSRVGQDNRAARIVQKLDQIVPNVLGESKKNKYSQPKWTKGLLKTAEDNQKLRNYDNMIKHQEEEFGELKRQLLDLQACVSRFPSIMSQAIKESTNFINSVLMDENESLKAELSSRMTLVQEELKTFTKKLIQDNFFDITASLMDASSEKKLVEVELLSKVSECLAMLVKIEGRKNALTASKEPAQANMLFEMATLAHTLEHRETFENGLMLKLSKCHEILEKLQSSIQKPCSPVRHFHTSTPIVIRSSRRRRTYCSSQTVIEDEHDLFELGPLEANDEPSKTTSKSGGGKRLKRILLQEDEMAQL